LGKGESSVPKEKDIPFLEIIKETFGPVFEEYGFELQDEVVWTGMGEYIITARKTDIELNFYLGVSQLFYYCSAGIKLSGKLGNQATNDSKYRNLGVIAIAECLDPEYKLSRKNPQTSEEVKKQFENRKEDLLQYCHDILSCDVSIWSTVVKCLKKKRR
jgi:hypothetical protein